MCPTSVTCPVAPLNTYTFLKYPVAVALQNQNDFRIENHDSNLLFLATESNDNSGPRHTLVPTTASKQSCLLVYSRACRRLLYEARMQGPSKHPYKHHAYACTPRFLGWAVQPWCLGRSFLSRSRVLRQTRHSHRADRISFSRFGDSVPRNPFSVAA